MTEEIKNNPQLGLQAECGDVETYVIQINDYSVSILHTSRDNHDMYIFAFSCSNKLFEEIC